MQIHLLTTLAWRNLWRHPRRTGIILLAISLGMWGMLCFAAFIRGMLEQEVHRTLNNLTGHIQLHAPAYRDDPVVQNSMAAPTGELLAALNTLPSWTTRIKVPAVVMSERESMGVTLLGIAPTEEKGLSFIAEAVHQGRYLNSIDDSGILLGRALAERLETGLGKRVVLMSQDGSDEIADRGFRVVGIFDAQLEITEKSLVFIARHTAQKMLHLDNQVSEIAVVGDDHMHLEASLQKLTTAAPTLEVADWRTLEPLLAIILQVFQAFLLIWYVVVFVAMSFGLVNTLLMAIFERTREIGMFQALGMRPAWIVAQVVLESLFLIAIGLLIGNLLSWVTVHWLVDRIDLSAYAQGYEMMGISSVIYPILDRGDVLTANLLTAILGTLASLYPAWQAVRIAPVTALSRI